LTKSGVHIFSLTLSILDKTKVRCVIEDCLNFVFFNVMLLPQFFNNVFKPNKAVNVRASFLPVFPCVANQAAQQANN